MKLDQRISLGEGEAVVREFSINSVTSSLKLECDKLSPEKEQYYVEITDMQGNKSLYFLVKKEEGMFIFKMMEIHRILTVSGWMGKSMLCRMMWKIGVRWISGQ